MKEDVPVSMTVWLVSDASKIALWALVERLIKWHFDLVDCQMTTPHMARLGAKEISREDFLARIGKGVSEMVYRYFVEVDSSFRFG